MKNHARFLLVSLFVGLFSGGLSAAPTPFQNSLEAYVSAFTAQPVDRPVSMGTRLGASVLITKASDNVVLVGCRPVDFEDGTDKLAAASACADLVANALTQIVTTFSARYHVALAPIYTNTVYGGQGSGMLTGYLLLLEPRANLQPFPSAAMGGTPPVVARR